jgi:hypothetical protein
MAAPRFAPTSPVDDVRGYRSPDHVPESWKPGRPGEIRGRQPEGDLLGYQGPDQGYALTLAARLRDRVVVQTGESVEDAVHGSVAIALRRASLYGRAPVIHDLTLALTIWGWFDASPPADLLARRRELFEGVGNVVHHYAEGRRIADLVPEATLRLTPDAAAARYPAAWRELTGA